MTTVAQTTNGNITGKVWFNDFDQRESKLVNTSDIAEIIGESSEWVNGFSSLEALNAEIYGISFTETPVYQA